MHVSQTSLSQASQDAVLRAAGIRQQWKAWYKHKCLTEVLCVPSVLAFWWTLITSCSLPVSATCFTWKPLTHGFDKATGCVELTLWYSCFCSNYHQIAGSIFTHNQRPNAGLCLQVWSCSFMPGSTRMSDRGDRPCWQRTESNRVWLTRLHRSVNSPCTKHLILYILHFPRWKSLTSIMTHFCK